jgi:saccharopine dehydrogenase-like NADP-dependent oxidoreductase
MKVLLLGVGMQGKAALHDLCVSPAVSRVVAADRDEAALRAHVAAQGHGGRVTCIGCDADDPAQIDRLFAEHPDAAIDLMPSQFQSRVAESAVRHGVHLVNTFYTSPDVQRLDATAREAGIAILPEFGLDPGIDLVLLGEALRGMDGIREIRSYGAGIPEPAAADNPLRYKVTWTFEGVLRAYRRSAWLIRDGARVEVGADDVFHPRHIHRVDVAGLGELEAYPNGDATRYLDAVPPLPRPLDLMGRYTMRWPGHCEFWKKIVDLGLLDPEPVRVDGMDVDRLRYLARALEPRLRLGDGERDVAVVRIDVRGRRGGRPVRAVYQVLDRRDLATGLTAMSRTVGFTASIGAQMIASGRVSGRGVLSPVRDIPYEAFVAELRDRRIEVTADTLDWKPAD